MNPPPPQIGLYQGFLKEIRKKVHRLLYHSLCTHVSPEVQNQKTGNSGQKNREKYSFLYS